MGKRLLSLSSMAMASASLIALASAMQMQKTHSAPQDKEWTNWGRSIQIDSIDFTLDRLVAESRMLAADLDSKTKWAVWRFGASSEVLRIYPVKPALGLEFESLRPYALTLLEDPEFDLDNFAQLEWIHGSLVLKANVKGQYSRTLLAGDDKQVFHVDGIRCEILHFAFRNGCDLDESYTYPCTCLSNSIYISVKTGARATNRQMDRIAKHLRTLIPDCAPLQLAVRDAEFFYDVSYFPVIYPFVERSERSVKKYRSLVKKRSRVKMY